MTEPPFAGAAHIEQIAGLKFMAAVTEGVAAGNLSKGYFYRSFHGNKCYELNIRIIFPNIGNYDPGTVKEFDANKVNHSLKHVLDSFKFLR